MVEVEDLERAVDGLLALDLIALSSSSVVQTLEAVEQQRRRLAAVDALLLGQVRDRGIAAERCRASVADLLTAELRVAPGEAKARVAAAEDLAPRLTLTGEVLEPVLPRVADALAAGQVSAGHVAVIGRTVVRIPADIAHEVFPVAEQFLVEAARHEHPRALEQTARMLLARVDPDGVEPSERNAKREFTLTRHASGWSTARGTLDVATTAALGAVLDALSAPNPAEDGTPDPRPAAHRRHDALHEMSRRLLNAGDLPPPGGVPTTVVVTTTELQADATVTGTRGETYRLGELQPCGDVACGAEIVEVCLAAAGAPLSLGRTRRLASTAQRLALAARDGGCCFPSCERPPAWTEAHHVIPWSEGGRTDVDNLCLLCAWHHREFSRRGWTVRMNEDRLPEWIPPDWIDPEQNPRHNHARHHRELEFAEPP